MSVITLSEGKAFLDVIHNADDVKIQLLIDAAEDEAKMFLNRTDLVEWDNDILTTDEVPASVKMGVLLLLQSNYQASPDEIEQFRKVAEIKLMPYRLELGI